MDEIETKPVKVIRLGKLEIEPHFNMFNGFGVSAMIGGGIFYHSVRVEFVLFVFNFGVHFIWNNPNPEESE